MKSSSTNGICSMIEDDDGTLWMNSYGNVIHYNPATHYLKEFMTLIKEEPGTFQALRVYKDISDQNFLWIGTWGTGLVHFNKQTGECVSYKFHRNGTKNLHNIVFNIHNAADKLWLATSEGIVIFNPRKTSFEGFIRDSINSDGIVNAGVQNIYKDNEGITWIGSALGLCN